MFSIEGDRGNAQDRIAELASPEDFAICTDEDVQKWKGDDLYYMFCFNV